ncbi:MAG: hypothetical protein WAX69_10625, partial [Victivallales bacterium]
MRVVQVYALKHLLFAFLVKGCKEVPYEILLDKCEFPYRIEFSVLEIKFFQEAFDKIEFEAGLFGMID